MNQAPKPAHIAIIMDGNGRWAKQRGQLRTFGHQEGLKAARETVKAAINAGIKYLSLYTFSTENWKRSEQEISFLMGLIRTHLLKELDFYKNLGVRVVHSGDMSGLPSDIAEALKTSMAETKELDRIIVNLAINYGGRDEILRAIKKCYLETGKIPDRENDFYRWLDAPEIPEPDLLIRTGGDKRLSNFLIWQSAYSEFYFTEKFWPDFLPRDLEDAISSFQSRERRFGGTK